jgi:hypothetical protein
MNYKGSELLLCSFQKKKEPPEAWHATRVDCPNFLSFLCNRFSAPPQKMEGYFRSTTVFGILFPSFDVLSDVVIDHLLFCLVELHNFEQFLLANFLNASFPPRP